jgi:hypothetical protein
MYSHYLQQVYISGVSMPTDVPLSVRVLGEEVLLEVHAQLFPD